MEITNKTGANDVVDISMQGGGTVIIDSTCTAGQVNLSGDGNVMDHNGNHMRSGIYNGGLILTNHLTYGQHLHDIWVKMGLDPSQPLLVAPASNAAAGFTAEDMRVLLTDNGDGTVTLQRVMP